MKSKAAADRPVVGSKLTAGRPVRALLFAAMIFVALVLAGCAVGNPGAADGSDLICAGGEAWVYAERQGFYNDGYVFRNNGDFCYVQDSPGFWSNDCLECYCGYWSANGSILTLTVDNQIRYVRYTISGDGGLTLYPDDDVPAFLVKVGGVNVIW